MKKKWQAGALGNIGWCRRCQTDPDYSNGSHLPAFHLSPKCAGCSHLYFRAQSSGNVYGGRVRTTICSTGAFQISVAVCDWKNLSYVMDLLAGKNALSSSRWPPCSHSVHMKRDRGYKNHLFLPKNIYFPCDTEITSKRKGFLESSGREMAISTANDRR